MWLAHAGRPELAACFAGEIKTSGRTMWVAVFTTMFLCIVAAQPKELTADGALRLTLTGTGRDYLAGGPYLTRVSLGRPPRDLSVLIDTGSNPLWVNCQTGLSTQKNSFNPTYSSTSSLLKCSEKRCQKLVNDGSGLCNTTTDSCDLHMNYGLGSEVLSSTSGYFLSDDIRLVINGTSRSSPITFGCANSRMGQMADARFDGIFGLGPSQVSFSSQIFSLGLTPHIFSFCMKRSNGGGNLVFGKINEPGIVYTELLESQLYYEVNLESINVGGQRLPLAPSVFRPSAGYKTFVDSGTTLVFLADDAYASFLNAIIAAHPAVQSGDQYCFVTSGSINAFPNVTLSFVDGASMQLGPKNYLSTMDQSVYCLAWLTSRQRVTVLGDMVLADKLIIHDMENMRVGWKDYDCSLPINATASWEKKQVNSAHASHGIWIPTGVAIIITSIAIFHP